ncbi:MAG: glycine cleavage system aminomethyltransferase GcvT [Acidobacteriota bacterium]|nr:glycine cleavage system aminomethyltransferase GcvT [Acidobacteriota bacterium]
MGLSKTSLNNIHKKLGGRMIDFTGWEMPVHYGSALREHFAVRETVGLFDVSHMGEIEILGKDAIPMAQKVTCNDIQRLKDGQAQYSALLYPEGTFVDDIVLYRITSEHIFICVNASNKEKDFQWICQHQEGSVEILDRSATYAQLALQGPRSEETLQRLTDVDLSAIHYYWLGHGKINQVESLISRTGYTGENGFEIYIPTAAAPDIWESILDAGTPFDIMPAGLAARNTLRLEMSYPLYGHEIDQTTTPWEANLSWIVKLEKDNFIGKEALEHSQRAGVKRKLVGFEMLDRGIAREHYPVWIRGKQISEVTSGGPAPFLGKYVGLTYLPIQYTELGQPLEIKIRGKLLKAKVVPTPFHKK